MSATVEKKSTKKSPAKKSAEVQVDGTALKKAITVREPKKMFKYGEVWGSRFSFNKETLKTKREFIAVPIESDVDIANEPEKKDAIHELIKTKLRKQGWELSDDKLIRKSLRKLEGLMDQLRHDIKYDMNCDRDDLAEGTECLNGLLMAINELITRRSVIADLVNEKRLLNMPKVVPPSDEYYIEDGKFCKKEPEMTREAIEKMFGFKSTDINSKDVPEPVRKLAKKLGQYGTVSIATIPHKDLKETPPTK